MNITVKKSLPVGFMHGGQKIRHFSARPTRVRDSIEAIEELGGDVSQARLRVAIEARQVKFDGIPDDEHTTDLFLELCGEDYGVIGQAIDEAEKKLKAQNAD